ncbi:hypothetical protein FUAX_45140 (plasmid) [Fulvitalea axinellae]|uniref:Sulfatase-modifying factor enzyme-like domain-containing protein n=1 Tax=Fulvitalea axinellae TaxID=1182444 RepID=A0AAU9D3E1_9BACT|nr:hypothetical protein FUAX_45140 [Fulvitalea axinellae]
MENIKIETKNVQHALKWHSSLRSLCHFSALVSCYLKNNVEKIKGNINRAVIDELFVTIPTGTVHMRDDRTKETWSVDIDSYELCKFPITQKIYKAVTDENPSTFKGANLPVETVSWIDAVIFCNKLSNSLEKDECYTINLTTEKVTVNSDANGFRLPTEAEWQYACQAGTKEIRHGELSEIAWFKENSNIRTQDVGQKNLTNGGFMICWEMFGNGVRTFMTKLFTEHIAFSVVGVGTTKKEALWLQLEEEATHFRSK